jgi:hypothetical protein
MASMSSKERSLYYFERLLKARNKKEELERVYSDINQLIYTKSKSPIDKATKIEILDELEKLIRSSPGLENLSESYRPDSLQRSTSASDNSEILDVISAMKKKAE